MPNPVLVNTLRGDVVENRHRGAIAVCDPDGRLIHAWGDVEALAYPRSAIKPLQALPLVESGAADHFQLGAAELALACSSHNAEAAHTEVLHEWLPRIGLDETALECGAHPPYHVKTAESLLLEGVEFGRIHNNCSGKHTAMLTVCRHLGDTTRGYIERDHPAQQRWFDAVGDLAGIDMRTLPWSRDGCGIPVIAMPLRAMATAFARFAAPDDLPRPRADASERLTRAIASHPFLVAGSERLCSEVIQLTGRRLLVKSGADGVYTAALEDLQLGVALKIDDGSGEAAEVALLAVLHYLGALQEEDLDALAERRRVPIVNTRGVLTGYRQAAGL